MRTLLISAMGCAPHRGSEQGVGWNWVLQMAKKNKVHVITVTRRKEEIERAIPADLRENITFHYFDLWPVVIKALPPATILFYLQYTLWQIGIIPLIYRLSTRHQFDFSIHLTFGSIWMPTFLPCFTIPFIWGPFGGGESVPRSFLKSMGGDFYDSTMQRFRYLLIRTVSINPFMLFAFSRARAILARTRDTAGIIPPRYAHKVREVLETAMEEFPAVPDPNGSPGETIRLISTGRLVPFKNQITAIRALGYLKEKYRFRYTLLGSGFDRERISAEVAAQGLEDRVEFRTTIPREQLLTILSTYDIYLFPSLREGGSWSLMEAMGMGLPTVCLNSCGMATITDEESAIRLAVTDPDQMALDMAQAIEYLINHPQKRTEMGEAAKRRIRTCFNWDAKGEFMENLLNELS